MKKTAKPKSKPSKTTKSKSPAAKKKYVESHWAVFLVEGIISLAAGTYLLFADIADIPTLVAITGSVLIGLAVIDTLNTLYRRHKQHNWGIALVDALFEVAVGIAMLCLVNHSHIIHIALLAGYALVRGITGIFFGFASITDSTSRFFWVVGGMVACIIAFVIFADPNINDTLFVKIFGIFLMATGLADAFYGIHSQSGAKK